MPLHAVHGEVASVLFWVWIGLIATAFAFWGLRHLWLQIRPPVDRRTSYSRRLAQRFRERQALRRESRACKRHRERRRP
jgi:hypothetical protein